MAVKHSSTLKPSHKPEYYPVIACDSPSNHDWGRSNRGLDPLQTAIGGIPIAVWDPNRAYQSVSHLRLGVFTVGITRNTQ